MPGIRIVVAQAIQPHLEMELDKDSSHHLCRVLRQREGSPLTLMDGRGTMAAATLLKANPKHAIIQVGEAKFTPKRTPELILVQVMPKGQGLDSIIRRATEIGVTQVIPLLSDHCDLKWDPSRAESKLERWRTIAEEACKQCVSPWVPEISLPITIDQCVEISPPGQENLVFVASLEASAQPIHEHVKLVNEAINGVSLLVGPEGDFSTREYTLLAQAGCRPLALTRNVLTVETATLYGLGVLDTFFPRS